ncbi:MAG TPA: DUF87 domain-containing protein [Candidatus Dormibacteraeota bacterium]
MSTLTTAPRNRGRATGRLPGVGPFRVDGDRILHPDGSVSAVLATSDLDVDALDATRRASVLASFARLCHTIDSPFQMLVRVEPVVPAAAERAASASAHALLDRAMRDFWVAQLNETVPHRREVLLATRAPRIESLHAAVARIAESTRAMGIVAHRLSGDRLREALARGAPGDSAVAWSVEPQQLAVGGMYVRGFALRRLPSHAVTAGWLAPLLRLPTECDIAIHMSPAPLGDALHSLGRRLRDFSAHRMLEVERDVIGDVHVDIALDSAFALRSRLARNQGRPMHLSITVAVRARTLAELHRRSDLARLAFQAALAAAEPAHFRHLSAYVTTLPLARDALGGGKLVESSAAATCIPWVEAGCSDPGGYRIGAGLRTGVPVTVAPFDTARHNNANVAVLAASGHGKSFAVGALVLEAATQGAGAMIIDPEGEYAGVVRALGGSYLALALGTDAAVNVFDTAGGEPDEAETAVTELIAVMCGGRLSDVQRAYIDAAARDARVRAAAAGRVPVLGDCLPMLETDARDVAVVVRRFCSGGLGALFNRPTTLRLDHNICAISLRDLPSEHVAAATLIVARWLWGLVRRDQRHRHIVFDEVGALCAHPALRTLLVQLARRCRKYGVSLVVATQNAQDLLGTDEGSVVATNCAIVLLGGHRPAETARMEHAFGLTPAQRHFLETAARGEFLLMAGDRRLEVHIEVPEMHHGILTGTS